MNTIWILPWNFIKSEDFKGPILGPKITDCAQNIWLLFDTFSRFRSSKLHNSGEKTQNFKLYCWAALLGNNRNTVSVVKSYLFQNCHSDTNADIFVPFNHCIPSTPCCLFTNTLKVGQPYSTGIPFYPWEHFFPF